MIPRLRSLSSASGDPLCFGDSSAYRPSVTPAAWDVLSVVLTNVCRALLEIEARNGSAFEESHQVF